MTITRNFKLYLNAGTASAPYINVNQYDEGEEWVFTLYNEDGSTYTPSTGAIIGIKSDGNAIMNSGSVVGGKVVITETQQMTAASGRAIYELLIDNATHGTANFIVNVERRPSDDAEFSDSDLSMLQEAIDAAEVINEILDEGGDPSEIIEENVNAWLDAHPEATTTVQDGAITAPKINSTLWDKLLVSEEASGAVASFDDGADDVPVSSLKVALEPVQLGIGDPSPSNVRPIIAANGKNMMPSGTDGTYTDNGITCVCKGGVYTLTGTSTGSVTINIPLIASVDLSPSTNKIAFMNTQASTLQIGFCRNGTRIHYWALNTLNRVASGWADSGNEVVDSVQFTVPNGVTLDCTVSPMLMLLSDNDYSYQPYQGISVLRTGKNLLNPSTIEVGSYTSNGSTTSNGNLAYRRFSLNLKAGTYTFSTDLTDAFTIRILADDVIIGGGRVPPNTFTLESDAIVKITIRNGSTTEITETFNCQLESGSTATAFEPYTGNSYPYTLGREVYGGSVDLATGVLTINRVSVTVDGSYSGSLGVVNSTATNPNGKVYIYRINQAWFNGMKQLALSDSYTNVDKTASALETNEFYPNSGSGGVNTNFYFVCPDPTVTDIDGVRTWLASHPFQLVYGLAEPQTYQLTPTQVNTLLGYNNISSTGTVDVIYHADTKLYIDKKIGELS